MKITVLFDIQRWMWIVYAEMNGHEWSDQLCDQECGNYSLEEMELWFYCALRAFRRAGQYL